MSKTSNNKINCWEYMKCDRGPGADLAADCESCPVVTKTDADDLNGGINGGRICWVIAESFCSKNLDKGPERAGSFCFQCEFRYKVMAEEGLLNVCNATGKLLGNDK